MTLSANQVKFFADYIQKELGIVYAPQNYYQLEKRLEDITKILQVPSVQELYTQAQQGITGNFKQVLLDTATNNETSFFRDPKVYSAVENHILPSLMTIHPKVNLYRIWSAASSFGQEPYSIAMMVHEFLQKNPTHPRFEIWGTDIADHALKRCREATYSQLEVQRGLPAQKLVKYFTKNAENYWTLKSEIKTSVRFSKLNLMNPFGAIGTFDIIYCRYVLIYQDAEKKKEIMSRIASCLVPKGYLILGASESVIGLSDQFDQIVKDGAIIYQKKS